MLLSFIFSQTVFHFFCYYNLFCPYKLLPGVQNGRLQFLEGLQCVRSIKYSAPNWVKNLK